MHIDEGGRVDPSGTERERLAVVAVEHQLCDLVGHLLEELVALLAGHVPVGDHPIEEDLDVDLVVGAVDAAGIVDGVGEDSATTPGELDAPALGDAEVSALADHGAAEILAIDS